MAKKLKVNSPRKMITALYELFNAAITQDTAATKDERFTSGDLIDLAFAIVELEKSADLDLKRED